MIDFILGIPWPLLVLLTVVGFAAIGVVGLSLTRRMIFPWLGPATHQNEVTAAVHHGILIIYGLAVALIAIAVWEKNSEVRRIVSAEAVAIGAAYRDAGGYPEPVRTHLRSELKAYTEYVIREAWPSQRRGVVPAGGVEIMDRFQATLFAFEPATDGQRALHQETLRAYNTLIQARRLRLDSVESGLPAPMWVLVLVGALVTLLSAFFFDVGSLRLHRLMVVMLSGIMGLLIFLIAFYDRPYRGGHGITPEAYELIHHQLMER
jgi:Protein of unknown function (DUF4239)